MSNRPRRDLLVADFEYDLPPDLIAQEPLADRAASRLLVLDRSTGAITHSLISRLMEWLKPGDLLVANNSRVLPARLMTRKAETGGRIELLLLGELGQGKWTALARPVRKIRPGSRLLLERRGTSDSAPSPVEVTAIRSDGEIEVEFSDRADLRLEDFGETPLPPYIHATLRDPERYQTVYASVSGSAAAPTAGLHLTPELIELLRARGIGWAEVTLHIGLDTFRPVTVSRVDEHRIHSEWCSVSQETAQHVAETQQAGGRVIAVGTTAARTLETLGGVWDPDKPAGFTGPTSIFIVPGYTWRVVDGLLTNFHLPKSTLLMMVSALAGREELLLAYREAIIERYRFFSFGDAMLIV